MKREILLFTGCTDQKGNDDQDTNLGNSVEIDDTDIEIDTEPGLEPPCGTYIKTIWNLCETGNFSYSLGVTTIPSALSGSRKL